MTVPPDETSAHNDQKDGLCQQKESEDGRHALCNQADALREQEYYEQAAGKCQEAIDLDPEFPNAYNSLGQVRAAQERFDEAIELFRRADALWQKHESKDRKRALCHWADGRTCTRTYCASRLGLCLGHHLQQSIGSD